MKDAREHLQAWEDKLLGNRLFYTRPRHDSFTSPSLSPFFSSFSTSSLRFLLVPSIDLASIAHTSFHFNLFPSYPVPYGAVSSFSFLYRVFFSLLAIRTAALFFLVLCSACPTVCLCFANGTDLWHLFHTARLKCSRTRSISRSAHEFSFSSAPSFPFHSSLDTSESLIEVSQAYL